MICTVEWNSNDLFKKWNNEQNSESPDALFDGI